MDKLRKPRVALRVLPTLNDDGSRRRLRPRLFMGRYFRARRPLAVCLMVLFAVLPFLRVSGKPAVLLDIAAREFTFFGTTFGATDGVLLMLALLAIFVSIFLVTAWLGRAWCGWACPQTVFIEALFRPIERLVNGPRNVALRRAKGPAGFDRVWRAVVTHALYLVAALFVAHVFLAYFVSIPQLFEIVREKPAAHPEVFAWMLGTTALFYFTFGIFREQFCVVMCPYGRLQSVLIDDDALVVGYDEKRGEPRGKAKDASRGDCVDCGRCVVVCPTGIDIRDGLQLDCIACTACIDACDDVMDKLGRERGLIRYDSLHGLRGEPRKILRPRVWIYTALLVIGVVVAALAVREREPFEANVLRLPGAPYTREEGTLRNGFEIHLVNKTSSSARFEVSPAEQAEGVELIVPLKDVEIEPLGSRRVPFFVTMEESRFTGARPVVMRVTMGSASREVRATFLGPERAPSAAVAP